MEKNKTKFLLFHTIIFSLNEDNFIFLKYHDIGYWLKSKSAREYNIDRLISIPLSQYRLLHLIHGHRITARRLL